MSDWMNRQECELGDGDNGDYGIWYPVTKQELWQTVYDCDVIERYQGYIENDVTGKKVYIEDRKDAEARCKELNQE